MLFLQNCFMFFRQQITISSKFTRMAAPHFVISVDHCYMDSFTKASNVKVSNTSQPVTKTKAFLIKALDFASYCTD